jgi:hypothetical protein
MLRLDHIVICESSGENVSYDDFMSMCSKNPAESIRTNDTTSIALSEQVSTSITNNNDDDNDQMMFIFGPKLFSQLNQIKNMEDEQRRESHCSVQRHRHRLNRSKNQPINAEKKQHADTNDDNEQMLAPNMNRYEPFVGERSSLTQEQIDYKQSQRKTRLFWEQTSRDIYLTVGFYNVDSTQTQIEFDCTSIYCRTKIRQYDRHVRIHLANDIQPEKCSFQVRRSNILITARKAVEGVLWTSLSNQPVEPRPDFFTIDYGSDDESDTGKQRRQVNEQWKRLREDKHRSKSNVDDNKFLLDDMDDDEQIEPNEKPDVDPDNDNIRQDLTETSSDCHSTDSDDCYYEDQVPVNHIPRGYDDADYDHRFYGQQIRT